MDVKLGLIQKQYAYHKLNTFEMWCYRRMLRIISWTSHTTNIDVQKIGVKETTMINNMKTERCLVQAT